MPLTLEGWPTPPFLGVWKPQGNQVESRVFRVWKAQGRNYRENAISPLFQRYWGAILSLLASISAQFQADSPEFAPVAQQIHRNSDGLHTAYAEDSTLNCGQDV